MRAVHLEQQHFLPVLRYKYVLVRIFIANVNHQGGLRSPGLHCIAFQLLIWAQRHLLSLQAVHLPGVVNWAADLLSSEGPQQSEWRLHPQVVQRIWERFREPQVDLFATAETTHCPLFFSLSSCGGPLGVGSVAHEWPKAPLYDFTPIPLLHAFLEKREEATVLLVAPRWPTRTWFSNLCQLLHGQPWEIPLHMDLLSQVKVNLWHLELGRLQLRVWPLNGTVCLP
ncbi:UNVERIFIED_CONTAM: hypothetical protein FKN15_044269 [Acipenser sinensis]